MPYCTHCGSEVEPDSNYCTECGEPVGEEPVGEDPVGESIQPGASGPTGTQSRSGVQSRPSEEHARRQQTHAGTPTDGPPGSRREQSPAAPTATPGTEEVDRSGSGSWTNITEDTGGKKTALAGAVVVAIGAFLPWLSVEIFGTSVTKLGIEGDGSITLILAILVAILLLRSRLGSWGRKTWWTVVVLGGLTALLAIGYIVDPWLGVEQRPPEETREFVTIGAGLYLTALGGVMTVVGALYDNYA